MRRLATVENSEHLLPLHVACAHGSVRVVDWLIEAGCAITVRASTSSEEYPNATPIYIALESGEFGLATRLLSCMIDTDVPGGGGVDSDGRPLTAALWRCGVDANNRIADFVRLLLMRVGHRHLPGLDLYHELTAAVWWLSNDKPPSTFALHKPQAERVAELDDAVRLSTLDSDTCARQAAVIDAALAVIGQWLERLERPDDPSKFPSVPLHSLLLHGGRLYKDHRVHVSDVLTHALETVAHLPPEIITIIDAHLS